MSEDSRDDLLIINQAYLIHQHNVNEVRKSRDLLVTALDKIDWPDGSGVKIQDDVAYIELNDKDGDEIKIGISHYGLAMFNDSDLSEFIVINSVKELFQVIHEWATDCGHADIKSSLEEWI